MASRWSRSRRATRRSGSRASSCSSPAMASARSGKCSTAAAHRRAELAAASGATSPLLYSAAMSGDPARRAIASVWKEEGPRVVGYLVRILRDVALAEELAHDALVAALESWPRAGVPDRPGAWLMTTAKHRALNSLRRAKLASRTGEALGRDAETQASFEPDEIMDEIEARMTDSVGDDVLRLIFTACHPVLTTDARVALTLRLIGGLTTDEIPRAFLTVEPTPAQRLG